MWLAKGSLLALWLFGFGTIALLYFSVYRLHLPPNSAVDTRSITALTTQNPLWWTALVVCFVLSFAIVRSWSGPIVVWIALLVTGLIPAGILTLFIMLIVKGKEFSQGHG
jgi:hypothetical protein